MVIEVPDFESFVEEARRAGAEVIYVVLKTERGRSGGFPYYHTRFAATAAGLAARHAGGPEKVLLRWPRDFGAVPADVASGGVPEDYRRKVEGFAEEAREKLVGVGFEVRCGEIVSL